jgi:hypothetical protein
MRGDRRVGITGAQGDGACWWWWWWWWLGLKVSVFPERSRRQREAAGDDSSCDAERQRIDRGMLVPSDVESGAKSRGSDEPAKEARGTEMPIPHAVRGGRRGWIGGFRRASRSEGRGDREGESGRGRGWRQRWYRIDNTATSVYFVLFPIPTTTTTVPKMMGEEDKREQHGSAAGKRGSSDGQRTLDNHGSSRGSQAFAKHARSLLAGPDRKGLCPGSLAQLARRGGGGSGHGGLGRGSLEDLQVKTMLDNLGVWHFNMVRPVSEFPHRTGCKIPAFDRRPLRLSNARRARGRPGPDSRPCRGRRDALISALLPSLLNLDLTKFKTPNSSLGSASTHSL